MSVEVDSLGFGGESGRFFFGMSLDDTRCEGGKDVDGLWKSSRSFSHARRAIWQDESECFEVI